MERTVYLVDNMVICSRAIAPYIESDFFLENVRIVDEVVYEARNSKAIDSIKKLQHYIEAKDCERLKQISQACVETYKILKLYEGCADAILLATALATNDSNDEQAPLPFETITPVIVTQEKGIRDACDILHIRWLSQASLLRLAKQFSNTELPLGI